jgi:predicted DsbA family dithiol-disulfide isomerase
VLLRVAAEVGLDVERARAVLESNQFGDEVREQEHRWRALGIDSVPSLVIDGRHLIQGGQPVEVFEKTLREIAAGRQAA